MCNDTGGEELTYACTCPRYAARHSVGLDTHTCPSREKEETWFLYRHIDRLGENERETERERQVTCLHFSVVVRIREHWEKK